MRVAVGYYTAGSDRRIGSYHFRERFRVLKFHASEPRTFRHLTEYPDNTVCGTVNMCGYYRRSEGQRKLAGVGQSERRCRRQEEFIFPGNRIVIRDKVLIPEYIGTIGNTAAEGCKLIFKSLCLLKRIEQQQQMNLLGCRKLHARHRNHAVAGARRKEGAAVAACVMVGQRGGSKPFYLCHSCNIVCGHGIVAAG